MKNELREQMKQKLSAIATEHAKEKSRAACSALISLKEFRNAEVVMLYMPIAGELDTTVAMTAAWRRNKTVVVPKVDFNRRTINAVRCRSLDEQFDIDKYGIRTPRGDPDVHRDWPVEQIDLVVTPALAFDRRGHRLGRGGGYYDRFLAETALRAVACGLAFSEQLLDKLPAYGNDLPVDILVTDREVIRFSTANQPQKQTNNEESTP